MKHLVSIILSIAVTASVAQDKSGVAGAVATPLNDLNLVHGTIPVVLDDERKQPYQTPTDISCQGLSVAIRSLDEVLGPDIDALATPGNPGLLERGGDMAGSAVKSAAEGVVPFRGWIRKVSGAERYSREVTAAITAGSIRRGFLKGMVAARDCR